MDNWTKLGNDKSFLNEWKWRKIGQVGSWNERLHERKIVDFELRIQINKIREN